MSRGRKSPFYGVADCESFFLSPSYSLFLSLSLSRSLAPKALRTAAQHCTALHYPAPAPDRTAAHRTAPHRTTPHRTAPHRSAPHRTAPEHCGLRTRHSLAWDTRSSTHVLHGEGPQAKDRRGKGARNAPACRGIPRRGTRSGREGHTGHCAHVHCTETGRDRTGARAHRAAKMSLVEKMKQNFQGSGGALNPEAHAKAQRSSQLKQEQAVKIAKARAARYNITLRAQYIKAALDAEKIKKDDAEQRERAKKKNQKPGRRHTLKAVKIAVAAQDGVAEALSYSSDPALAKQVVTAAASFVEDQLQKEQHRVEEADRASAASAKAAEDAGAAAAKAEAKAAEAEKSKQQQKKKKEEEAAAAAAAAKAEAEKQAEAKADAEAAAEPEPEVTKETWTEVAHEPIELQFIMQNSGDGDASTAAADASEAAGDGEDDAAADEPAEASGEFEMTELREALEKDDDQAINKAIVKEFIEEHAPEKLSEVDNMLKENEGKEDQLMEKLAQEYEDPAEKIEKETEEKLKEEEGNIIDAKKKEAAQAAQEEEDRIAAMDDDERAQYLAEKEAREKHQSNKDRMLKQQLNIYSAGGTSGAAKNILGGGGRGRGRGGRPKSGGRAATEYIVSAKTEDGRWSVNTEE